MNNINDFERGTVVEYHGIKGVVEEVGYGSVHAIFCKPVHYNGSYSLNFGGLSTVDLNNLTIISPPITIVLQKGDYVVYYGGDYMEKVYSMVVSSIDGDKIYGQYGEHFCGLENIIRINNHTFYDGMKQIAIGKD